MQVIESLQNEPDVHLQERTRNSAIREARLHGGYGLPHWLKDLTEMLSAFIAFDAKVISGASNKDVAVVLRAPGQALLDLLLSRLVLLRTKSCSLNLDSGVCRFLPEPSRMLSAYAQ